MTISVTVGGEDPMAGTGFYAEAGGIQAGVIVSNTDFTPIGFSVRYNQKLLIIVAQLHFVFHFFPAHRFSF
jgi:hypothetical protein